MIPPIQPPADTELVKRIKIQSEILTKWWGHPIYLGATVLLPKGLRHASRRRAIRSTTSRDTSHCARLAASAAAASSMSSGWRRTRRAFIYVTLQHPSPYYDDSYGVNSENNGPYGDAIMQGADPGRRRSSSA